VKPVLFATGLGKDLNRAENIRVLYDAYDGEKAFVSTHDPGFENLVGSGKYDLLVIDVFPTVKPQTCIMIWHAIQGGKYIGLDQRGTYYRQEMARLIDYIIVAGRGGVDMFHRCTCVPKENILNMGMPRTDRYFEPMDFHPNPALAGKRVYLFAPTFRGRMDVPMPEIAWKVIDDQLMGNEVMLVKAHPYGREFNIQRCRHITEVPRMDPTYGYLRTCDVVITDYSSIMFDAYLLGKPAVLFEKETGYATSRGMYLDYPGEYCSRYATNEKDMVWLARFANGLRQTERACLDYVADMCDGHSCERICRFIREVNGE